MNEEFNLNPALVAFTKTTDAIEELAKALEATALVVRDLAKKTAAIERRVSELERTQHDGNL